MKFLKIIFVVSIIASLGYFIGSTDLSKAATSLHKVGANFIIVIFSTFIAYFLGAIGWKYCFGAEGKNLSLSNLFFVRHVGETVGLINPAGVVGGEAVKVALLNNKGIERKTVITSVLISRVVMIISQVLLFIVAALILTVGFTNAHFHFSPASVYPFLYITIALLVLMLVLSSKYVKKLAFKAKALLKVNFGLKKWRVKAAEIINETTHFFTGNKKALAWSFLFFALHWVIGCLEFYLILKFLGIHITIVEALFLDMGVILFKAAGSFVPAQIGVEEYGNKVMLSLLGIAGVEVWLTVSIIKRTRQLFWILLGVVFYLYIYKRHRNVLVKV